MEAYAGAIDYGALSYWWRTDSRNHDLDGYRRTGLRLSGLRYLFFSQEHGIVYDGLGAAIEAAS